MILKVVPIQYIYDHHKHRSQYKAKQGLTTKKPASFANVLEKTIKSKPR